MICDNHLKKALIDNSFMVIRAETELPNHPRGWDRKLRIYSGSGITTNPTISAMNAKTQECCCSQWDASDGGSARWS